MTNILLKKLQKILDAELNAISENNIPTDLDVTKYVEDFNTLKDIENITLVEIEMLRNGLENRAQALQEAEKKWFDKDKHVRFYEIESLYFSEMHLRTMKLEMIADVLSAIIYAQDALMRLLAEEKSLIMPMDWSMNYIAEAEAMLISISQSEMFDGMLENKCKDFERILFMRKKAIDEYSGSEHSPCTPPKDDVSVELPWLESMNEHSSLLAKAWENMKYIHLTAQDALGEYEHRFSNYDGVIHKYVIKDSAHPLKPSSIIQNAGFFNSVKESTIPPLTLPDNRGNAKSM